MTEPLTADEALAMGGVTVTAVQLAEARQQLAHRGVLAPTWAELTPAEQATSALEAAGWLRAMRAVLAAGDGEDQAVTLAFEYFDPGDPGAWVLRVAGTVVATHHGLLSTDQTAAQVWASQAEADWLATAASGSPRPVTKGAAALADWLSRARTARSLRALGERLPAWSTGELLAVALILDDTELLANLDYTADEALDRLRYDIGQTRDGAAEAFAQLRAQLDQAPAAGGAR